MQDTPHSAGAAHTEAELRAGGQHVPSHTQYSHTTSSNLKLSPLVESCPRSIYSTGTAGRGLGSRSSGHGAPAVHEAPAPGPARSSCCPAVLIPPYPTPPTQTSILRGLGQSYRRCRGARSAQHCHMLQWAAPRTHGGYTAGLRSRTGSSGTCCTVGLQPLQESWLPASNKTISSYTARVTPIRDRCLQQMSVPMDHVLQRPGWIFSE